VAPEGTAVSTQAVTAAVMAEAVILGVAMVVAPATQVDMGDIVGAGSMAMDLAGSIAMADA